MDNNEPLPTAAHRVLHLPELLTQILSYLPPKDLLLTQRTSRTFRLTTQSSIHLRRTLFLTPNWTLPTKTFNAWKPGNAPGPRPQNNRLLLRAFPGCYPTISLVILRDGISAGGRNIGNEEWSWDVCISFPHKEKAPELSQAVAYEGASWRNMFLSQPPCKSLYLVRRWQRGLRPAIYREEGVRMGDFFDEVTRVDPSFGGRRWHESFISSDSCWHFEGPLQCSLLEECRMWKMWAEFDYCHSRTLRNATATAYLEDVDASSEEAVKLARLLIGRGLVEMFRRRGEMW